MDMIDAHNAHNAFTGTFELQIFAKLAKLFSDVLQWGGASELHFAKSFQPLDHIYAPQLPYLAVFGHVFERAYYGQVGCP